MSSSSQGRRDRAREQAHAARRTPRMRSLILHWLRRALTRPERTSPSPLPPVEPGQVCISFGGHATALIRYAELSILCDPMLASWCRGVHRESQPGIADEALSDVDLVLISHQSSDHLHPGTLARLPRSATVVVPPRTAGLVSEFGFARVVELAENHSVEHRRVDVAALPARYGGHKDPALSYAIRGNGPSIFFCGDSGYFDGFAEIGRRYLPDIALLPIGGYSPRSFRQRHMSPLDALYAFEDLSARVLIPIRHGAFALSYERIHDPERWMAELVAKLNLDSYVLPMAPGESRLFVRPGEESQRRAPSERSVDIDFDTGEHEARPDSAAGGNDAPELPESDSRRAAV